MPVAIRRIECLIIAVGTAAPPYLAVTVRTGKATVKRYFLHLATEYATQIRAELIVIKNIFAPEGEDNTIWFNILSWNSFIFQKSCKQHLRVPILAEFAWRHACKTLEITAEV